MATREIISNINPERIKWCCDEVNISLDDLSKKLRISLVGLEQAKLTFNQLNKVAEYFGYWMFFFLQPEPPESHKIHSAEFLSLAKQKIPFDNNLNKLVNQVEQHRDIYLGLLEDMGEQHHWQQPKLTGSIKEKAIQVSEWLGINSQTKYDFTTYRQLLEAKGLLVFLSIRYAGKWKVDHKTLVGFSIMHGDAPTIFIKTTSPERQTFTLFHELGHLLLHGESFIDDEDNLKINSHVKNKKHDVREQEANQFAEHCLSTNNFFTQTKIRNITNEEEGKPSRHIPRVYRYKQPKHIFGNDYVDTVFSAMYSNTITLNRASDYLDRLKIDDIKKLGKSYG